jgi:hypothetical protein
MNEKDTLQLSGCHMLDDGLHGVMPTAVHCTII